MEAGQRFGQYLLLKHLAADVLGNSYRAGLVGASGIERVVLLRLFDGEEVPQQELGEAIAERVALQSTLRSPHLGQGVDLGSEEGIPYVAYDYVSGRNLLQLQHQARDKPFPIPVEHALFIVERVALGLTAAYEARFRGERLVHGFLTPSWIWLSSEGEVRLLGVDAASGLQTLAPETRQSPELRTYLSPEVVAGQSPTSADDIFSLAAILFELLTGQPLPADGDHSAAIDDAVLAAEGTPVPEPMRDLLRQGLAPRDRRLPAVDKWRLDLSKVIAEGDHNPTTFNLAFFLHTLFRGEIEAEIEEIEKEKAGESPWQTAPAEAPAQEVTPEVAETIPLETVPEPPEPETPPAHVPRLAGIARATSEDGRRKKVLFGSVAAALVLIGLAVGYYLFFLRPEAVEAPTTLADTIDSAPAPDAAEPPSAPVEPPLDADLPETASEAETEAPDVTEPDETEPDETEPEVTAPDVTAPDVTAPDVVRTEDTEPPPTPEELEQQVRQLVARGVGEMEATLTAEYEARLTALRDQLEEAREEAAERQASEEPPPPDPQQGGSEESAPPESRETTEPPATAAAEEPGAELPTAAEPTAAEPPAAEPPAAEPPPPEPADADRPASRPEPEQAAPQKKAERGDLVTPGPGVTPPKIIRRPRPIYPAAARKFSKQADVKLRLLVDENGRPERIEQVSSRARFGFDEAAEAAARKTIWEPATKDGVAVKMWVDLTISFRP